jgi:hypothetical protein
MANYVEMRGGVAKVRVETGRWQGLAREERVCKFCDSGEVENVGHMLARCGKWKSIREEVREWWEERGLEEEEGVDWTLKGMGVVGRGKTQMTKLMKTLRKWMKTRIEAEEEKEREDRRRAGERRKRKQEEKEQKAKWKKAGKRFRWLMSDGLGRA